MSAERRPLAGRVAAVTGSGRGIGRALVLKLAHEGAHVVINDLEEDLAQSLAAEVQAMGGRAVVCAGDITASSFAERFVQAAVDGLGGLDIIVNNAGYTRDAVIQKMDDDQWDEVIAVHLRAPFQILRAAQPVFARAARAEAGMPEPRTRKVVNVASIAGTIGNAGQSNYSAAKAGLLGLTRTLAKEWGRYRVTVNGVAFGLIQTRLAEPLGSTVDIGGRDIVVGVNPQLREHLAATIPLGRIGTPEDAADAIYLFCSPDSDYVSGQVIVCAGGADG